MFNISYDIKFLRASGNDHKELYHPNVNKNDAGIDIFVPNDVFIEPKSQVRMPLGVHCSVLKTTSLSYPKGENFTTLEPCSFFLLPRSSISKTPLRLSNSVGLIDAGYRGELQAPVDNISDDSYLIKKGTRLFQIVNPALTSFRRIEIVDNLSKTDRGEGGFGSTGN